MKEQLPSWINISGCHDKTKQKKINLQSLPPMCQMKKWSVIPYRPFTGKRLLKDHRHWGYTQSLSDTQGTRMIINEMCLRLHFPIKYIYKDRFFCRGSRSLPTTSGENKGLIWQIHEVAGPLTRTIGEWTIINECDGSRRHIDARKAHFHSGNKHNILGIS